ncbi:TatD family hydrolase [Candidatus Berkelbacteria bacterium]|nr:TatD family hydrolase [Candidatus Berkelbacteria bacterium]
MYIDIHSHLNFKAFEHDWREVLARSLKNKVEVIIPSTDLKTSQQAIEIAKSSSGARAAVGFHPVHVLDRDWRSEVQHIRQLASHPKVVAIGEVGLDDYIFDERYGKWQGTDREKGELRKTQERILQFFIEIAAEVKKPLILHCRNAEDRFLKLLATSPQPLATIGGDWHCSSGTLAQVKKALELGLHISYTGLITYNNTWDAVIPQIPASRLMIETDSPYLTPVPHRGERNEPSYVVEVAKKIAALRGVSVEKIEQQTYANAQKLFKLS